ncbi:cupin domain-containing protein [Stappia indica]|uniref:cupin domain-containing protein n=1 Tax=Stappia indica TaxID=538381 RepID=UPI001D1899A8|nr:cupin domain-containing protein [Stappia indica]MCC4247149.1 cupin domain-containing protein [Stappia indica]
MNAPAAPLPAGVPVAMGRNPAALTAPADEMVLRALAGSPGKLVYRDAQGRHCEEHLGIGLRPAGRRGTYCFMNLEAVVPELPARLAPAGIEARAIDRVNLYISPPGAGTPLHFDARTVIVVQLSGRKLWQVAGEPALADPRRNVVADEAAGAAEHEGQPLVLPEEMRFAQLEPGDWLLVPAGTWHGTYSAGGSVSATLAFGEGTRPDLARLTDHRPPPRGQRLIC